MRDYFQMISKRGAFLLIALFAYSLVSNAQQLLERPRYKLHSGDQISVVYALTPEYNQTVTIQPDGYIILNAGGEVQVEGKTVDEATDAIRKAVSVRLNDPQINISLVEFQKPYFVVAGEVQIPAKYEMKEKITVLQALMMAGGTRISAKETQIVVLRAPGTESASIKVLNLKNVKSKEILERDIALNSGDIVYVPRNKITKFSQIFTAMNGWSGWASSGATIATR